MAIMLEHMESDGETVSDLGYATMETARHVRYDFGLADMGSVGAQRTGYVAPENFVVPLGYAGAESARLADYDMDGLGDAGDMSATDWSSFALKAGLGLVAAYLILRAVSPHHKH